MKILFICGSLEQGLDGVGDYTRRLAVELIKKNYRVIAVALHDHHISSLIEEKQSSNNIELKVLRLPASWKPEKRYTLLAHILKENSPDWISLQYVGFGLDHYGLPWKMLLFLKKEISKVNLHIMFHELWCGMSKYAGFKEQLAGSLQKAFIYAMVYYFKPKKIFTSIPPYSEKLKQLGIKAEIVPIFGNIPTEEAGYESDWLIYIKERDFSDLLENPNKWLSLGFFGTVYPCQGLVDLIFNASVCAARLGRKLRVISIGHGRGIDIESMVKCVKDSEYYKTGSISPSLINRFTKLVDLGVVTSPTDGLNKSGAAVAWMERGIPILISSEDKTYNKVEMEAEGVFQVLNYSDILRAFQAKGAISPKKRLIDVANSYISLSTI